MKSRIETRIDEELADFGVKPYMYHILAYGKGSQRKLLRTFKAITLVGLRYEKTANVELDVAKSMINMMNERMIHGNEVQPATFMLEELRKLGYYGVAICDRRDNFSRKRGRIIAKGRLLKYLRSFDKSVYERRTIDQRVVAKGILVKDPQLPKLVDGVEW